ncbi:MAG: hypothetical protein ACOYO0_11765 [Sandarakinorhabdus sp.]|jgi:hypothetical protein
MLGIILIGLLNVAMFVWFGYLFSKDPANIFKRRRPPGPDADTPPSQD